MMLIDAGKIDRAESELRQVLTKNPDFYDANRVLGRILLDRGSADRERVEEALKYLQAAYKIPTARQTNRTATTISTPGR
jgi:tetratricopeptide (TPR) repeat protein